MAAKDSCAGRPRLPVWSSPTVLIDGEPAGTAILYNARIIAEQARASQPFDARHHRWMAEPSRAPLATLFRRKLCTL